MKRTDSKAQFVVCVKNDDCSDLELRKMYEVLPDPKAAKDNYVRIIDESGEDYLYPANYFYPIKLPKVVRASFRIAA